MIYKQNGDVLALLGEAIESLFYVGDFGFGVDDEEVALGGGGFSDVLGHCVSEKTS